jgi:hypothetical protein
LALPETERRRPARSTSQYRLSYPGSLILLLVVVVAVAVAAVI